MNMCKTCGGALLYMRGVHGKTLALDAQYVRRFIVRESQIDGELVAQEVDTFSLHVCPQVNGSRKSRGR